MKKIMIWLFAIMLTGLLCVTSAASAYNYFPGKNIAFSQSSGKVVGAYIPNWAMDAGYDPTKLPPTNLTHLMYAFLTICGPGQDVNDQVVCATKNNFELAVTNTTPDNAHHAKFLTLKQTSPNLKIIASIGGASGSNPFFYFAGDTTKRTVFVNSVKNYLSSHPAFDGVDIDWEVPTDNWGAGGVQLGSPSDSQSYVYLMRDLRAALNSLGASNGHHYLLTSAINTDSYYVGQVDYKTAQQYIDYYFAMTYDYYGGWSNQVGHHTALYPNIAAGIKPLLTAGVAPSKLVQGVAMYSRGWGSCTNTASPMKGTGNGTYNGSDGSEHYLTLAGHYFDNNGNGLNGYQTIYDSTLHAYYLWNASTRTFIGYDDPRAVAEKGQYAVSQNLAGIFAWEISQDNGDILSAMNFGVGNVISDATQTNPDPIATLSTDFSNITTVGTSVKLNATGTDNTGIGSVTIMEGTTTLQTCTTALCSTSVTFNTLSQNGTHNYTAHVCNASGRCVDSAITAVTVNFKAAQFDRTAPTIIGLTASTTNLTSAGSITLSANVRDTDSGISKVEFYKVGRTTPVATIKTSPYRTSLSFTSANNGTKQYFVKAYDSALANNGSAAPNVSNNSTTPITVKINITVRKK